MNATIRQQASSKGNSEIKDQDITFAAKYPLCILIADDVYINRRILSLLLKRLGYEADTVENGRECLQAVVGGFYDLLFSDIDMPEMNGIECTHAIREAGLDLSIFAVTASSLDITRAECLAAGMNGYMRKPVSLEEIKSVLRKVSLQKAEMPRETAGVMT